MYEQSINWGKVIEENLNFGREDNSSKLKKIDPKDLKYMKYRHYSHVMIYAKTDSVFEDQLVVFKKQALVLMEMRCDGYLGFPGGVVNEGETPLKAVCREVKEKLNWFDSQPVSEDNFMFAHVDEKKECVFNFYLKEVSEKKFLELENSITKVPNYGNKVLGYFRVPLFIMGDAFRGFPSFLRNHFIHSAKLQLIESVVYLKFFTEEQVMQALHSAPLITK